MTNKEKYLLAKADLIKDPELKISDAIKKYDLAKAHYDNHRAYDDEPVLRMAGRYKAGSKLRFR